MRYIIILLSAAFLIWTCKSVTDKKAYAQFEDEVTGEIQEINYETSMILLKSYINQGGAYTLNNYYVLSNAVIEKDGSNLELNQLSAGDDIVVHYVILMGTRKIDHIWVKSS